MGGGIAASLLDEHAVRRPDLIDGTSALGAHDQRPLHLCGKNGKVCQIERGRIKGEGRTRPVTASSAWMGGRIGEAHGR